MGDGLKFTVQGAKFIGQVLVILEPDDVYSVLFGEVTEEGWLLKEVYTNIYCDQLVELIDEYVETTYEEEDNED
jgi:hypothetical protein